MKSLIKHTWAYLLPLPLLLFILALACKAPGTTYPDDLQPTQTILAIHTYQVTAQSTELLTQPPELADSPTNLPPSSTPSPTVTETPSPTQVPPQTMVRIGVIGDFGTAGQALEDVSNLIKSWNVDYIVTTGDNNYPDGAYETIDENIGQYFHEFIAPYTGSYGDGASENRFFPTLGNHDYTTDNAQPYFDYFTLPGNERYYDILLGPVHLFAVNSDWREPDGVGRSSIQAAWLRDRLAVSTSSWKIVVFHATPYSSGYQGSTDWMRWPFKDWGASIVLAGHDHNYERLEVDGFTYITNGLGGGAIYNFIETIPGSQVRYNDDYGAMLVTADDSLITFQFISRGGEIIDTYQLSH